MERAAIRLEVLKLCVRGGRQLTETLAEAEAFYDFIVKPEPKVETEAKPLKGAKKIDKPDILS